jgi:hypothetical protein
MPVSSFFWHGTCTYGGRNRTSALGAAVVIYIDKVRKARVARLARLAKLSSRRNDEELLCVNWNPAFGAIAMSCYQTPQEWSPQLPDDDAALKPGFVTRVHALASQI